jgi:hypothetical protein
MGLVTGPVALTEGIGPLGTNGGWPVADGNRNAPCKVTPTITPKQTKPKATNALRIMRYTIPWK